MVYSFILNIRHFFYNHGWIKSTPTEIPSVCIGNIAMGGTGKTPMAELVIKTLKDGEVEAADSDIYGFSGPQADFPQRKISVLSRGYKRKSCGFQQVVVDGSVRQYGDEPLQIKRKYPDVTVVVDRNRREAAGFLADPSLIDSLKPKKKARILNPEFQRPDIIILDDAFQHRKITPNASMVLTSYNRPFSKDRVAPFGKLRDLRKRVWEADMIVVTKCPSYMLDDDKPAYAQMLGLKDYNVETCAAITPDGREIKLLFSTIAYDKLMPVFPDGDAHYMHAKMAVAFSGIADGRVFKEHIGDIYRLLEFKEYDDHHNYGKSDIRSIADMAKHNPLAVVVTTEKDAQRLMGKDAPEDLRRRLFYAPMRIQMLTAKEQRVLKEFLLNL